MIFYEDKNRKDFHEFYIYNCFSQISIKFSFSNADNFWGQIFVFLFVMPSRSCCPVIISKSR